MGKTRKQEDKSGVTGIKNIAEAAANVRLAIPRIRPVADLATLAATVQEKKTVVGQIAQDVAAAFQYVVSARKKLAACADRLERKIVTSEVTAPVAQMEEYLQTALGQTDAIYKSAAALAHIKTAFTQQFSSYEQAAEMLRNLIDRGLLVANPNGKVGIGYEAYDISQAFGLDDDDVAEVVATVGQFSRVVMTLVRQQREDTVQQMKKEAELSLAEAMLLDANDKPVNTGKCLVFVPAESYIKDGEEQWRGGGHLLLDFQRQDIVPVQASGSIEKSVERMTEMGVALQRHTLTWDNPPASGSAFERVKTAIADKFRLSDEEATRHTRMIQTLWHLIQRGIKYLRENEARAALKTKMAESVTITPAQFFGLNGSTGQPSDGIAFLEFSGSFHQDGRQTLFNPFLLAKRAGNSFSVVELPAHLTTEFGELVGKDFPADDNFNTCPLSIKRLLRAIRGQANMATATSGAEK